MTSTQALAFFSAVKAGDAGTVSSLIAASTSLLAAHDPTSFGATALIHAVNRDDRKMVDLLLDLGADINQRSDWWAGSFGVLDSATPAMAAHLLKRGAALTPHAAARFGDVAALRRLIAQNAACVHARGGDGQSPLHFAADRACVDALLDAGADIDLRDLDHNGTPAQWMTGDRAELVPYMLERGCAPDAVLAVVADDPAVLEAVEPDRAQRAAYRISAERFPTQPPAALHIYAYTIGNGCTLLHAAARANRPAMIRKLAADGADVNARGGYDDGTPLHQAAWCDAAEAIEALADAGARLEAPSGHVHHNEPLGWAIVGGAERAVRALLARGAEIRKWHRKDAAGGVQGAFREYQRGRPLSAWQAIAALIERHPA